MPKEGDWIVVDGLAQWAGLVRGWGTEGVAEGTQWGGGGDDRGRPLLIGTHKG